MSTDLVAIKPSAEWTDKLAVTAKLMLEMPQVDCPLRHAFAPGVYIREIFMPAGTFVIGKIHKTEHFNIILKGKFALVGDGGHFDVIEAPCTFKSGVGVSKALFIYEDCTWQTVHATDLRDIDALDAFLWEPHPDYPPERVGERDAITQAALDETKYLEYAT